MVMEEDEISNNSYLNLLENPNPSLYTFTPPKIPSTSIDRFLLGGDFTRSKSETNIIPTTNVPSLDHSYLRNFMSSSSNNYYDNNNPCHFYGVGDNRIGGIMHGNMNIVNESYVEEVESRNSEVSHEAQSFVSKGWKYRRNKGNACVKGQWTTEEDR